MQTIGPWIEHIALAVDVVGLAVMLLGFVLAMARFAAALWRDRGAERLAAIQTIRHELGTYLVFALELLIVSDLLHSVVSHTLDDLAFLAALVAIRTAVAYFLNKEISELAPRPT